MAESFLLLASIGLNMPGVTEVYILQVVPFIFPTFKCQVNFFFPGVSITYDKVSDQMDDWDRKKSFFAFGFFINFTSNM